MMYKKRIVTAFAAVVVGAGLTSCGSVKPSKLVAGLGLSTYSDEVTGDAFLQLDAQIDSGKAIIPNYVFTITKDNVAYGTVTIQTNHVVLDVNMTEIASVEDFDNTLPNGANVPVVGVDPESVVKLPAGSGVDVFVSTGNGVAMLGFAVKIKAFDGLSNSVGMATICNGFSFGGEVNGTSCVFSGSAAGQNGVAGVADMTLEAKELAQQSAVVAEMMGVSDGNVDLASGQVRELRFDSRSAGKKKEKKTWKYLYKNVHRKKRTLYLH